MAENVSGKDFAISSISPSTVNLKFDRMVTKKFNVDVKMEGLVVPEEGDVEKLLLAQRRYSVTGPVRILLRSPSVWYRWIMREV